MTTAALTINPLQAACWRGKQSQPSKNYRRYGREPTMTSISLATRMLPCVTGKLMGTWNKPHKFETTISKNPKNWGDTELQGDCVTVSDEAVCLFLYENQYEKWMKKGALGWPKNMEEKENGKWSTVRRGKGTLRGWKRGAMERYNELYDYIKGDRSSEKGKAKEEWLLEKLRQSPEGQRHLKRTGQLRVGVSGKGEDVGEDDYYDIDAIEIRCDL